MASSLFFNGRSTKTPSTVTRINDTAEQPTNLTVGNVLAIVGTSTGGQPNTALSFGSPTEVAAVLVDGPLCYAAQKAFAPSDQTNAPSTVVVVRVGQATASTAVLLDSAGQPAINLTSTQFGLPANQTKVKIETGSVTGKRVTTAIGTSYFTQDNVGRNAFTVQYSGSAGSATLTISPTQAIVAAPTGTVLALINLSDVPTVAQLTDRINAVPGFSALTVSGSENTASLYGLDSVTAQDVKTALYTATANLQAVVDWLNGLGETYVTAVRPNTAGLVPANVAFTYLTGALSPAPIFSDWSTALNVLQTQDVQWVVPLSGDPAVHAATDAHVQYMSTVARRERRALCGPAAGTTLAAVLALPLALDSDRTSICWPGYYDFNAAGVRTLYDPFYTALVVAAGFSGADPGTPMTNKTFTVRGLETLIRNPTDTDQLIGAGVLCLEGTSQGFKVVRSISTWLANDNYNRVEVSVGAATDYVARTVRDAVDPLRGSEANPIAMSRAISQAQSALLELARPQPAGPGIIVGDALNPPFKDITASIAGDILSVSFTCSPVIPVNFIPISIAIVPYSGTAAA